MHSESERHRLSAFIDGLVSGVGLILILWGLFSLMSVSISNTIFNVGLVLLGVTLFTTGGFREAYTWGKFSSELFIGEGSQSGLIQPEVTQMQIGGRATASNTEVQSSYTNPIVSERIRDEPAKTEATASSYESEKQTYT